MKRTLIGMLALASFGLWPPAHSAAQDTESAPPSSADVSTKRPPHQPTRIRVHPLVQSYPGPDAVRQCASWLATEYRPSGTVIVPRQHCWWERG